MRTLLLAGACMVMVAAPALACRGTAEYPQLATQLEQSQKPPEHIAALMEQVRHGQSLHEVGHREGDISKMLSSLSILDALKVELDPWVHDFSGHDAP